MQHATGLRSPSRFLAGDADHNGPAGLARVSLYRTPWSNRGGRELSVSVEAVDTLASGRERSRSWRR